MSDINRFYFKFQHIVVANGGLGNDVTLNELHRIFQTCGDVLDIVMQPNKPYSFVSYVNLKSVTSALKTIHGRSHNIDGRHVFFYLNCVEQGKLSWIPIQE